MIIGLYSIGTSYKGIKEHIKQAYDVSLSATQLSEITDRIIPDVQEWQGRQLEAVYPIVFLDVMFHKVKDHGVVKSKALYSILGIDTQGQKDILGHCLNETEGAKFWLKVLTDLRNRGVEDMLIVCTDNLKGFAEAVGSIFPKAEIQTCIVHQIRNSLKYVGYKHSNEFLADLKMVYQATTRELAEKHLVALAEKWGPKYPLVIKSWEDNWERLSTYFAYTPPIRRLIYTTNDIEGYHRQIHRVTKTKGAFPNDIALLKLAYLATKNIEKKWSIPLPNWGLVAQQLAIKFGDRMPFHLPINMNPGQS